MTCAPNATRTRDLPLRRSFPRQPPTAALLVTMSAVCASFWHATGTVCSLPPAPVCSTAPGLASPSVHKYEAQHDYKNDAEDKHKTADAEAMARLRDKRDTGQHYLAPTE